MGGVGGTAQGGWVVSTSRLCRDLTPSSLLESSNRPLTSPVICAGKEVGLDQDQDLIRIKISLSL